MSVVGLSLACLLGACGGDKKATGGSDGGAMGNGGAGGAAEADAAVDVVSVEGCPTAPATRPANTPLWSSVASLKNPQTWYATPIAAYIAENVLFYQNDSGGWPKNIDMSYRYGVDAAASPRDGKSMIDNDATTTQIRFLAYMLGSFPTCARFDAAFTQGLNFLFNAQYPANGGWPQVWPIEKTDYSRRITYNDNAMVHVMQIMRDIVYKAPLFHFVSDELAAKATSALSKGVDCMLKTQIMVDGKRTGWCAQHDEVTLLPANARAYELASHSGKEGAQVAAFLMTLDLSRDDVPRAEVVDAVQAAVAFYDSIKILGYKYVQAKNDAGVADSWIEADPAAGPLWARFYELEPPFKPFFCDRNGIKVYSLAEVGVERRGGYAWYVTDSITILGTTYPAWVTRWNIGRNVLTGANASDGGAPADAAVDGGASTDAVEDSDPTDVPSEPDLASAAAL